MPMMTVASDKRLLQNIKYNENYNLCIAMCPTKVPLRGTSISRCLPPSCEPQRGSCMVLLMIRLFEPFDLFEVMTWSFATPSNPPHHGGQLDFLFLPLLN